jgi:lycopene cyclase domain-containing protein
MSGYMKVLLISSAIPLIASFWPGLKFYRNFPALAISLALTAILFGAWDIFAVWRGHWSFDPGGICGIHLFNLPLEEVLFFILIPFCCIFTWEALIYIRKRAR